MKPVPFSKFRQAHPVYWVGLLLILVGLLLFESLATIHAANIVVNSLADDVDNDGECTLREAIIAANSDTSSGAASGECGAGNGSDIIDLTGLSGTINLGSALPDVTSNIVFNGPGAANLIITGGGFGRLFKLTAGDVTISGVTLANGLTGAADGRGGGIFNSSSGLVRVVDSTLFNNQARGVGGSGGTTGCCFGGGGGIFHTGPGRLEILQSTFSNNQAIGGNGANGTYGAGGGGGGGAFGGALFNDGGTVEIVDSIFQNNAVAGGNGGNPLQGGSGGPGGGGGGQAGGMGGGGKGGNGGFGQSGGAGNFGGGGGGGSNGNPAPSGGAAGLGGGRGGSGLYGYGGGGGGGAGLGGGIFHYSGVMTVTGSTFITNQATGGTGGSGYNYPGEAGQGIGADVFNWATLTVEDSSLTNSAPVLGNYTPSQSASDLPLTQTLNWQATDVDGDYLRFDVAFGPNPAALVETKNVTPPFSPPISLDYQTTYYWVITATDGLSTTNSGLLSFTTFSQDYYVDVANGNDLNGNGTGAAPWRTITYALSQVTGPDIRLRVAPGTYSINTGESFPINLPDGISLIGADRDTTILSGASTAPVVQISSDAGNVLSRTVLSDLTVQNGSAGVRVFASGGAKVEPTLANLRARNNTHGVQIQTGVYLSAGVANPTLRNVLAHNNSQTGIYIRPYYTNSSARPEIYDSASYNNGAEGIWIEGVGTGGTPGTAAPIIRNTLISNNGSHGIYMTASYRGQVNPDLEQNRIEDNSGWGVYWQPGINGALVNANLYNNIIAQNMLGGLSWGDGGPSGTGGTFRLVNNTVADNQNYGLYWKNSSTGVTPFVVNTIVWNPEGDDLYATALPGWTTAQIQYSNIEDGDFALAWGNFSTDPQFTASGPGDYHVLPTSPVIDVGDNSLTDMPSVDVDGQARPFNSSVDVGADEAHPYTVRLSQTVWPSQVQIGGTIVYTLTLENLGDSLAGGVVVTDLLPAEVTWNGSTQTDVGQVSVIDNSVRWQVSLATDEIKTLRYEVTVNDDVPVGTQISNTAAVAEWSGGSTGTSPTTVTVIDTPVSNLSVSSSSPTLLGETTSFNASAGGSNVTYAWDFGDGAGAVGQGVNHTYTEAGVYTATVTASNTANSLSASTTVTVDAVPTPILQVTPTDLTFSATEAGANPPAKMLTLENRGTGTLAWTASADEVWLSVTGSGTAPSTPEVTVDIAGLAPGVHTGQITLAGTGALNSPQTVNVTLIVEALPPAPPLALELQPGPTSIYLAWEPSSDPRVSAYRVTRAVEGQPPFTSLATLNTTTYVDDDPALTANTTYCYRIEALKTNDEVVTSSNTACTVFGKTTLWVPEVSAAPGQIAFVPVNIRHATGLRIAASDIWLDFDATVIEPLGVVGTPLTTGYTWSHSVSNLTGGYKRAHIAALSSNPPTLYGQGSLFWLRVRVLGNPNEETPLDLREFISGVGGTTIYTVADPFSPLPLTLEDGKFRVASNYILGDINGNGVVEAIDAYLALSIATGKFAPTPTQRAAGDVNGNGRVDAADATMIFYYVIHADWPLVPFGSLSVTAANAATPLQLSLDNVSGAPGATVETTLRIDTVTDMAGGEFTLVYDPAMIEQIVEVTPGSLTPAFTMEFNDDGVGLLRVALADDGPINGEGDLLTIKLRLAAAAGEGSTTLALAKADLNDLNGRDFATSALQQSIERKNALVEIKGEDTAFSHSLYLPMVTK